VKRVQRQLLVAIALATLLVSAAACGHTAPQAKGPSGSPDPIVGTWRQQWLVGNPAPDPPLIMTKTENGYLGTFVIVTSETGETPIRHLLQVPLHWRSRGFGLTGRYRLAPGYTLVAQVAYDGDTKFLRWSDSGSTKRAGGVWQIWVKVSDSTALPTPSP
jgi:hypothetical protein